MINNKQKNILWCHSHFMLPTGGTKYVFEVARRLNKNDNVIMVVEKASDYWKKKYEEEDIKLIEISKLTSTSMIYWAGFPIFLGGDYFKLNNIIKNNNVNYMISSFFPFNFLCSKLGKKYKIRHSHLCYEPFPFFHDKEVQSMYSKPQEKLMKILGLLYGWMDKQGVRNSDYLMTLNGVTKTSMEKTYNVNDVNEIYAGIDYDHFYPRDKNDLRKISEEYKDKKIIVHSTDFSPIKRTDLMIEALRFIDNKYDYKLLITSTIENEAELKKLMKRAEEIGVLNKIKYLGFVDYNDVPRYYSLADVLVQTGTSVNSGATSMSLPVKEAMSCETAVIRSGVTGEDVIDEESGFLVDPTNSKQVGEKISIIFSNPSIGKEFGKKGREDIMKVYDWDKVTQKVCDGFLD